MLQKFKHKIAMLFTIFFLVITVAPAIIASVDTSIDISSLFGFNEEEESEKLKLTFEDINEGIEDLALDISKENQIGYRFKKYPKPHLNLISPPPEAIIL